MSIYETGTESLTSMKAPVILNLKDSSNEQIK